ncbi:MAG: hypothetical protein J6B60_02180 [Clostridia bacterium]|nr:hypothetical protein [Clostridia bacterium]
MDRYSKTIDTDTTEFLNIEDSTPTVKHSTASKIFAIIVCLFLAIVVWLHVMNTSTENVEYIFNDVEYVENGVSVDKDVTIKVIGTKSFIADAKRSNITVYYDYENCRVDFSIDGKSILDVAIQDEIEISDDKQSITITVVNAKYENIS